MRFIGESPPTLDDIKTEPNLVNLIVEFLFVHRKQLNHKTMFKWILATTILRFHYSFHVIIGNEPSGKYKDPIHQPFHQNIISVPT